ncbi:MAG: dihydrolipoyl dehydrogenase [Candidatus Eremiobacterota bacterium]
MSFDLIVIGGGPGGYVGAIRAAQLGLKVVCVEKEPRLGGTCLRVGCIPSKALLESSELYWMARHELAAHGVKVLAELDLAAMMGRKGKIVATLAAGIEGLFKKHAIRRVQAHGRIVGPGQVQAGSERLEAPNVLIATGSLPASLRGVPFQADRIGTSTEALEYGHPPGHLVVIGAGAIGLELGSVWARVGSRVTVLEYLDRILPGVDGDIAASAQRLLQKQGLAFRLGVRVTGARVDSDGCVVEAEGLEPIQCDRVLVAVGRRPNTEDLGLDSVGIQTDPRGFIPVDQAWATAAPGIYAIGDVIGGPMLAHKAEEEAVACVERLVTGWGHVNYDAIPGVVYTQPEVASVGKTQEELEAAGIPFKVGRFPFMANGRARTLGHTDGEAKILAHAQTDRILGVHILGPRAGDLIAEAAAAIEFGASSEDLARVCHAHPTLPEVLKEAALAVDGRTLNL